jgi:lysophospholipase L1-like esterase
MQTIPYNHDAITRLGRWQDSGSGIWSGWGGSQIVFDVIGTTSVTINATVICAKSQLCVCECVIDNSPQASLIEFFAKDEAFSGARSVTFMLPDAEKHRVVIKTNGYNSSLFSGATKSVLNSIGFDDGATITAAQLGPKLMQCVGDSWMAADHDWPRLIRADIWKTYQIATGGLKASDMNAQYNFSAQNAIAADPFADLILSAYGVNEYNAGHSVSTFQSNMLSVVDKIRLKQPGVPIVLVQVPRNLITGATYDQYGAGMQNISRLRSKVYYIPTSEIWGHVTWLYDNAHLDASGKLVLAKYVEQKLADILNYRLPFLRVAGQQYDGETIISYKHALRYRGSVNFGCRLRELRADENSPLIVNADGRRFTVPN